MRKQLGVVPSATTDTTTKTYVDTGLAGKVATTVTVNGHALSSNVTVTASDVGAITGSSPTITTPTITGYVESVVAIGSAGSAKTISLSSGTFQTATLTSATACTFTMPTATAGTSFQLYLKQPATGTVTTATFTGVKWGVVGAPTITATLGKMDILTFAADGTNWYGSAAQGYTY